MANCSYARCIQERRIIKRELQRWTKGMVYIVGLERVAEELMGRRKWKLYQELIARSNQNITNSASTFHQETSVVNQNSVQQSTQQERPNIISQLDENFISSQTLLENQLKQKTTTIKCETINIKKEIDTSVTETGTENQENLELQDDEVTKYIVKIEPKHLENIKNSSIKNNNSIHSIGAGEAGEDGEEENNTKKISPVEGKKEEVADLNSTELIENDDDNIKSNIPIDWKPQDKCYFCVDGKLLTVNENGDLVAESGYSAQTETDIVPQQQTPIDSDSESSGSLSETDLRQSTNIISGNAAAAAAAQTAVSKTLENLLKGTLPNNMTSLESMAATIQAVAALQGLHSVQGINSLYPSLFYQALAQPQGGTGNHSGRGDDTDHILSMNDSAHKHGAGSSELTTNAEQPLDLSAKPSASTLPVHEIRNVTSVRAKPRVSTVPGRRTYTEDELQRALQDIISGKLGTRRAAVLYGIPRSTLRNKVYKLSMEQKREALIQAPPVSVVLPEDEEKDLSDGDEDKDLSKNSNPLLGSSHILNNNDRLNKDNERNSMISTPPTIHPQHSSPQPQTPPIMHQDLYATNVMLQSLLFQGGLMSQKPEETAVFLQNLVLQQEMLKNAVRSQHSNENAMNNGKPSTSPLDARLFPLLQQKINHKTAAEQSELGSPQLEANESDESNVILKIPSFKPIAAGNTISTAPTATSPAIKLNNSNESILNSSFSLQSPHHVHHQQQQHHSNNLSMSRNSPPVNTPNVRGALSPTLKRQNSDSQSPPVSQTKGMLTLHEVIASSISKSFQQQSSHHQPSDSDAPKRPQISVIRNLGGTDISRFANSPNMMSSSSLHASLTGTGGKGTRPKRGKYRNYDRDSLVEAVKAVQRGEMSVHRAGSYYGVPHSTLEYKVKERHLMRPRKREPKPQPLDGTSSSTASSSGGKSGDITASSTFRPADKSKSLVQQKPSLQTPPPQFSSPSPNGMKMPMFDPAMAAQLQYTSQLLWPHPPGGFSGLSMDFPRPGGPGSAQFPTNPEQFFATQMMQKFQENSSKMQLNKPSGNSIGGGGSGLKNPREFSDNMYDVANSNGSLLDGIIRQSLDRGKGGGSGEMSHSSLLDQLSKSNCSSSAASDDTNSNNGTKRSASPLNYSHIDIKRERSSPITTSESDDRDTPDSDAHHSDAMMMNKGAVENILRIREDLTLRSSDDQTPQCNITKMNISEDQNGGVGGASTLLNTLTTNQQQQQSEIDDGT